MDETTKKHIEEIRQWLEDNVQIYPEPATVTLSHFIVDWDNFSGEFKVSFDSVELSERFRFEPALNGKSTCYMPMFHSPLGASASYAAIEITEKTRNAINKGLQETIPAIEAAGLDRKTGKMIAFHTPPIERVEKKVLEQAKNKVINQYKISIDINK